MSGKPPLTILVGYDHALPHDKQGVPQLPPDVVFMDKIEKEYRENELRAAKKYRGTRVRVIGTPLSVSPSFEGPGCTVFLRYNLEEQIALHFPDSKAVEDVSFIDDGRNRIVVDGTVDTPTKFAACELKGHGFSSMKDALQVK